MVLAVSYMREALESYFRENDWWPEGAAGERGGTPGHRRGHLRNARRYLDDTPLLQRGHRKLTGPWARSSASIAGTGHRDTGPVAGPDPPAFGVVEDGRGEDHRLPGEAITRHGRPDLINAGVYAFSNLSFWISIPGGVVSLERAVFPVHTGPGLFGHRFQGYCGLRDPQSCSARRSRSFWRTDLSCYPPPP